MNVVYILCIAALFLLLLTNSILLGVLWYNYSAGLRVTGLVAESLDRRISLLEVIPPPVAVPDYSNLMPVPCRTQFDEIASNLALMPVPCRTQFDEITELLARYDPPRFWVIDPTVNIPPCPSLDSSSASNNVGPPAIHVDSVSN